MKLTIFDCVRYVLTLGLLICVWRGNILAIKVCLTLSVIANEILGFIIGKLLTKKGSKVDESGGR